MTAALALRAGDDAVDRLVRTRHADDLLVAPRGQDRRLVDEVGQVGAGEARRSGGRRLQIDRPCRAACPCTWTSRIARRPLMSGRSRITCRSKRPGRSSAGSRTSGRLVAAMTMTLVLRVEAVHLDQDLVERLLALVVAAAQAGAALAADGVDLVDEDDARARCAWPDRRGRARGWRRRRRTSRRTRSRRC